MGSSSSWSIPIILLILLAVALLFIMIDTGCVLIDIECVMQQQTLSSKATSLWDMIVRQTEIDNLQNIIDAQEKKIKDLQQQQQQQVEQENTERVINHQPISCPTNYLLKNGICVIISPPPPPEPTTTIMIPEPPICGIGTQLVNGVCEIIPTSIQPPPPPPPPQQQHQHITWFENPLHIHDADKFHSALASAFDIWQQLNPDKISFTETTSLADADIIVHWDVKSSSAEQSGQAIYTKIIGQPDADNKYSDGGIITIHAGGYDCTNTYRHFEYNAIRNTALHEIGHILRLEHVNDEHHLMYSADDGVPLAEFKNTNGLEIPPRHPHHNYYEGARQIESDLHKLETSYEGLQMVLEFIDHDITKILERHGHTRADYDMQQKKYGAFTASNTVLWEELRQAIEKYNMAVENSNQESERLSKKITEWNCFIENN